MGGYYSRYFTRLWKEVSSKLVEFLFVVIATGGSVYAVHLIGLEKGITDALVRLGPVLLWVLVHAIRTPVLLDKDRIEDLAKASKELAEEKGKNLKPELVCRATDFRKGFHGTTISGDRRRATLDLIFALNLTNRRPIKTNVVAVEVESVVDRFPVETSHIRHRGSELILEHGIEKRLEVSVDLSIPAEPSDEPGGWRKNVVLQATDLKVQVVDAFGQRHRVEMPTDHTIEF